MNRSHQIGASDVGESTHDTHIFVEVAGFSILARGDRSTSWSIQSGH